VKTNPKTPTVIILAAGLSTRLWPLGDKNFLRLGEQSFLQREVAILTNLGFGRLVVVVNPGNETAIRAELAATPCEIVVQTPDQSGMGGGLLAASTVLGNTPQAVLVTHAHANDPSALYQGLLSRYRQNPDQGCLVARYVAPEAYFAGGYLQLDAAQRVRGLVEKPGLAGVPLERLTTIVAHLHPDFDRFVTAIKTEVQKDLPADDLYERALSSLCQEIIYYPLKNKEPWLPLKYPWDLLPITEQFLAHLEDYRAPDAEVSSGAHLVGPIHLAAGVKILWGAEVIGPTWIGQGTVIGQFSMVRTSFVGDNCTIGVGSEVAKSYLGTGTKMHASRVLDSVTAPNEPGSYTHLGAGLITGNLRLDEGEVRSLVKGQLLPTGRRKFGAVVGPGAFIGLHVGLMPGVKIGARAKIYPGSIVYRDILDESEIGRPD
jgi:bifunctional UDP-N-acetylglucosamine pyrophosphorylase/glucosamine-1-phosphate N-acetyltransferase